YVSGTVDSYTANSTVELLGQGPSEGTMRLFSEGNKDGLSVTGTGDVLGGELAVGADVEFSSSNWEMELEGKGLNVIDLLPTTDGWLDKMDILASSRGSRRDSILSGTLSVERIAGTVRGTPFTLAGSGRLEGKRFQVDSISAHLAGGTVRASGEVYWEAGVGWRANLEADEFDPDFLVQEPDTWRGRLATKVRISGVNTAEGIETHLIVDTLHGVLREKPIAARTAVHIEGTSYRLDSSSVLWGEANLLAFGELSEQLWGRIEIDVPDMSLAVPGAEGSIRGEVDVSGTRSEPEILLSMSGSEMTLGGYGVQAASGQGELDFSSLGRFDFSVTGLGLTALGQSLDTLTLGVAGVSEDHRITLGANQGPNSANLLANGGITEWTWTGNLDSISLFDSVAGQWQMETPVPVVVARDSVVFTDPACIVSESAFTCVSGSWIDSGVWSIAAEARAVPLARFRRWLPPTVTADGTVDVDVDLRANNNETLVGSLSVDSDSGVVSLGLRAEEQVLSYERGSLVLTIDEEGIRAAAGLVARQDGTVDSTYADLNARLTIPGYRLLVDSLPEQSVEGLLDVSLSDLSWIEVISPYLAAVTGSLESSFFVSGTVSEPVFTGEARLAGTANVPQLGLELRDVSITAVGDGAQGIGLAGSITSDSNPLEITGRVYAGSEVDTVVELRLSGTRIQAANTAEAQIWISPDIGITASGGLLSISGDIEVPRAEIELRQIPAIAVPVSRDVVLIGDTTQSVRRAMDISSNVRLLLGDSVNFRGFGLTASPSGNLLAVDEPGQVTTATGQLFVQSGKYRAYGQDLTIETGRLIFAGGPIDNPGLDIRAIRQLPDSVTAGLLVAGTLKAPELTVFSDPPMLQSDALSYLILGRPVSELSQREGGQLTNAAASLGLRGGNMLAQRIGQRFGIDEARIETDGAWREASFFAGKYLSPRLYVSYGIGLFESSSLFRVRYLLSPRWTLQAETGERTSTDINYRVERDR
ncbi:MAG: translocation/assembly module TamB domain-containing protein, partial [Myxococcota bacterium]|nr:translocation/assembly module TamB domain-containing protein [Myxococcota bacterium]